VVLLIYVARENATALAGAPKKTRLFSNKVLAKAANLLDMRRSKMTKISPLTQLFAVIACSLSLFTAAAVQAAKADASNTPFTFKDKDGKTQSVSVVSKYYPKKLVYPTANVDRSINPQLMRAATIAQERAHAHSRPRCWQYVKEALLASGAVSSYPKTAYAKEAGQELVNNYGFKKLAIRDPFKAPVGSVLVYTAAKAAGHVEIRTKDGFVSDFRSKVPSPRPLIGVYAKS
jgi:hypothetical protein